LDPYERRRLAEAKGVEQWKRRQVESGAADLNENFIPVENWRLRVAAKTENDAMSLGDDW